MKLDINTINKIAKLARIRLSEEEAKDLLKDMNSILDWVEQLNEVDTDTVEPLANISSSILPQRKDEAKDINSTDEILKNSNIKLVDAPKIKISSSHIRYLLKENQKIDHLVPKEVIGFLNSKS